MSIQFGLGKLNEDIAFLTKNEANRFIDVSIDDALQLIQRKKSYKDQFKNSQEYQLLKGRMKSLKLAKLPFRVVEIINDNWKEGKELPVQLSQRAEVNSGILEVSQRKEQKRALRERLVVQAKQHEEALHLVEQINFLHGTNSALLPMIHDTLELVPSGRLLDAGRAPMGGEIHKGGMSAKGINQHSISAETIGGISRCWVFASAISKSFDSKEYSNPEKLFVETLRKLAFAHPEDSEWDPLIITLLRLKQWEPEVFEKLCEDYKKQIEECKKNVESGFFTRNEEKALEVINYEMDSLMELKREKIPQDFEYASGVWAGNTWEKALNKHCPLGYFLLNDFVYLIHLDDFVWNGLLLKMFAAEELKRIQNEFKKYECMSEEDMDIFDIQKKNFAVKLNRQLKKIVCEDEIKELTEADVPLIFEKLFVEKMQARISQKKAPFKRRYQRLLTLFDAKPMIHFKKADREMIENPFGILFASTKAKASPFAASTEYNFTRAKLGEDIDLAFVASENKEQMSQWVNDHGLAGRVKVLDSATFEELWDVPLYHAPDQLKFSSFLMDGHLPRLNDMLNNSVFPLYQVPYTNGASRFWHGVPHAVRAVLFAQVLIEMVHAKGVVLKHDTVGLLLAMALHDVARQNDGTDLWDKESGQAAKEVLMRELELSEEDGDFFAACIAEKDAIVPTSIEQRIIHDGDCIDVIRCLRNPSGFKVDELRMNGILDEDDLMNLIREAKAFIRLTDQGVVKEFLETAKNPYQALLQIVIHAFKEYGMFETLAQYTYHATGSLAMPSQYLLTAEVEAALIP